MATPDPFAKYRLPGGPPIPTWVSAALEARALVTRTPTLRLSWVAVCRRRGIIPVTVIARARAAVVIVEPGQVGRQIPAAELERFGDFLRAMGRPDTYPLALHQRPFTEWHEGGLRATAVRRNLHALCDWLEEFCEVL